MTSSDFHAAAFTGPYHVGRGGWCAPIQRRTDIAPRGGSHSRGGAGGGEIFEVCTWSAVIGQRPYAFRFEDIFGLLLPSGFPIFSIDSCLGNLTVLHGSSSRPSPQRWPDLETMPNDISIKHAPKNYPDIIPDTILPTW